MMKYVTTTIASLILLFSTLPVFASITTYTLNKEQTCNTIFNSPNFNNFLALREFLRVNPSFVSNFNPADYRYCLDLKVAFSFFHTNQYTPEDVSQFYQNCINLTDQQVAFEYESFLRVQSAILNCRLN